MQRTPFILLALFLTACAPIATPPAQPDSAARSSTGNGALVRFSDAATGLRFDHPPRMRVEPARDPSLEKAGETGWIVTDPDNHGTIDIVLHPYNTTDRRTERICEVQDGLDCKKYGMRDLVQQRDTFAQAGNQPLLGRPGTVLDEYSAPGGNLARTYVFFTGKYRVSVFAKYDVFPLYEKQLQEPGAEILALVKNDIGDPPRDPIGQMGRLHPEDTTLMRFYRDADALVRSISTEDAR